MMMDFKQLSSHYFLNSASGHGYSYWKNYQNGSVSKLDAAVVSISFAKLRPYSYAVSNGFQVQLRNPASDNAVVKTLSRFKSKVTCLSYRYDGKLLAAGDEAGATRLFDCKSKTELRAFKNSHSGFVSAVQFLDSKHKLASCGEDGKAAVWDLGEGKKMNEFTVSATEHARRLEASHKDPNLFVVGSGDGKCFIYDTRQPAPLNCLDHGFPITALKLAPADNLLFTAGDCWVKVWSLREHGRPVASFRRHHKHVTCLSLTTRNPALLSCGLDGLVKVTDLLTYEEVYKYEYPNAPLLSMDISRDDKYIVLGSSDKWLQTRQFSHSPPAGMKIDEKPSVQMKKQKNRYLQEVRADKVLPPRIGDHVQEAPVRVRLSVVDKKFKTFRHSDALTYVIKSNLLKKKPADSAAVILELVRRGALRSAVAGRSTGDVVQLLTFCTRNLVKPNFTLTLLALADCLCDLYVSESTNSPSLRYAFVCLRRLCAQEVTFLRKAIISSSKIGLLLDSSCSATL